MAFLKTKTQVTSLEADLAALNKRKVSLEAREAAANGAVISAVAERRILLTDQDDPSAAALASADRACREAEDARTAVEDALAEVCNRITDMQGRIERLRHHEQREAAAASLEAAAERADDAIATILKAVAEIDRARTALAAAISPEAIGLYAPPSNAVEYGPSYLTTALFYDYEGNPVVGALTAEQVAARVVGHLLAPTLPSLGIAKLEDTYVRKTSGQQTGILAPIEHAPAAKALLTDNMRARAVKIRRPAPQVA